MYLFSPESDPIKIMYIKKKLLLKPNLDQRKVDQGVTTAAVMTADFR